MNVSVKATRKVTPVVEQPKKEIPVVKETKEVKKVVRKEAKKTEEEVLREKILASDE